jgi:hypothetical protein
MCGYARKFKWLVRRAALVCLAVWLCGASCLFCCQADSATAAASTGEARAQFAVPATHACCKARTAARTSIGTGRNLAPAVAPSRASDLSRHACAHDALLVANRPRRQHAPEQSIGDLTIKATTRSAGTTAFMLTPLARSRLPDGRATHVRLAVFLI